MMKNATTGAERKVSLPAGSVFAEVLWDEAAWPLVKAVKIRGYSMGGRALRVRVQGQPEPSVLKRSRPSWGQRLVAGQRIEFR